MNHAVKLDCDGIHFTRVVIEELEVLPLQYKHDACIVYCIMFVLLIRVNYKKLSYRRGTARCVVSIEILPIATRQCRNYLYDKS